MNVKDITSQILKGTSIGGKSYAFNDGHDANLPAQMWFQRSQEGHTLFIVFYSQACRWSRCLGCNLPSKMSSRHVGYKPLMAQIDRVFADPAVTKARESIRKVIVSNNGSILDQATFSSTALMYLLAKLNLHFPKMSVLSIESRPEYVDVAELEFISRTLAEGETPSNLEIAIGFEAFDDHIRNHVYKKGLTHQTFSQFVERVAPFKYHLKCYFMQKPVPGMTDADAVRDIQNGIDYLDQAAGQHSIAINMHLNPTYVSSGTILEDAFRKKEYVPPRLIDVARAARHAKGKRVSVFIGLSEEGMAVPGGSFTRPGEEHIVAALEQFNQTQDHAVLDSILDGRSDG